MTALPPPLLSARSILFPLPASLPPLLSSVHSASTKGEVASRLRSVFQPERKRDGGGIGLLEESGDSWKRETRWVEEEAEREEKASIEIAKKGPVSHRRRVGESTRKKRERIAWRVSGIPLPFPPLPSLSNNQKQESKAVTGAFQILRRATKEGENSICDKHSHRNERRKDRRRKTTQPHTKKHFVHFVHFDLQFLQMAASEW